MNKLSVSKVRVFAVRSAAALAVVMVSAVGGSAIAGDYTLKVSVNPSGGGTVEIDPKQDLYVERQDVEITAAAKAGYTFDGWTGASTDKSNNITIEMSGNKNKVLTANFKALPTLKDKRDGKTYKTVVIGNQTWMAENLNFGGFKKSACYDNKEENCKKYGRLYTWETAMKACPAGYHLPTDAEWDVLMVAVGGVEDLNGTLWREAGTKLKSSAGWNANGNGTNAYGFSALPGGRDDADGGKFIGAGYTGFWWSATENDTNYALYRSMDCYFEHVTGGSRGGVKWRLYSVRCVQD